MTQRFASVSEADINPAGQFNPSTASVVPAGGKLSAIISDGMIFQRDKEFKVFGTAKPGKAVSARMGGRSAEGKADADGNFTVVLPAFATGVLMYLPSQMRRVRK